jgi:hypothetical protein
MEKRIDGGDSVKKVKLGEGHRVMAVCLSTGKLSDNIKHAGIWGTASEVQRPSDRSRLGRGANVGKAQ